LVKNINSASKEKNGLRLEAICHQPP